jgi:hypothetical protein
MPLNHPKINLRQQPSKTRQTPPVNPPPTPKPHKTPIPIADFSFPTWHTYPHQLTTIEHKTTTNQSACHSRQTPKPQWQRYFARNPFACHTLQQFQRDTLALNPNVLNTLQGKTSEEGGGTPPSRHHRPFSWHDAPAAPPAEASSPSRPAKESNSACTYPPDPHG